MHSRSYVILSTAMAIKGYALAIGTAVFGHGWNWPLSFLAAALLFSLIALTLQLGSLGDAYRRGYRQGAGDFRPPSKDDGSPRVRSLR